MSISPKTDGYALDVRNITIQAIEAKNRQTGYAASPLRSGLITSDKKPSEERSAQTAPPIAKVSLKTTLRTEVRGVLQRASPVQLASSFQPAQGTPIFAVTLAEFRHSPSGHAGGPHVVVTFPPALLNSPRPHEKFWSEIVILTTMHRRVARIMGATQYPRRQMF